MGKDKSIKEKLVIDLPILEAKSIDADKGIYEITLIKEGLTTDKRRYYPRSVLESAVTLFEGTQAFADHPTKSEMKDRPERSIRDLIGVYDSVRLDESSGVASIKANLNTMDSKPWVRDLLNMAIESSSLCGASIHADGTVLPKGRDGADLVESIKSVFSTDIVTKPNAGGGVERHIESERDEGGEEMKIEDLTIDDFKKAHPELLETFKKEALEAKAKEDKDKGKNENFVSKDQYEALRVSNEEMVISQKITESKILEAVKDEKDREIAKEDLTESLKGKDKETMDKIIEARKVFLKGIGAKVTGNAPKDVQVDERTYKIGSLLSEAKPAYESIKHTIN